MSTYLGGSGSSVPSAIGAVDGEEAARRAGWR